MKKDICQEHEN